jgi:nucleoside transporter
VSELVLVDARSPGPLRARLAVLMFGQYVIWGTWFVSLGSWLGATLHFSGTQIGMIYGTLAIAGLVTPMLGGAAADRLARTERILALLHALGGVIMIVASRYTTFVPLYASILVYALCYLPTLALAPSLAMRHLAAPSREFPVLRALGTVGWIVGGLVVGLMKLELTAVPMQIAGAISIAFAFYCLTLPATPPARDNTPRSIGTLLGFDAIKLLRNPLFAIFLFANVALCVPNQFYNAFGALYLTDLRAAQPATLLTLGQATEVIVLLMLPRLTQRLGIRPVLLLGAATWAVRCVLFSLSTQTDAMLYAGLLMHGLAYGCTFIAGQIVVHQLAPENIRAAAQGFWAVATMGVGNLAGAWIAGRTVQHYSNATGTHSWDSIWLVPAAFSLLATVGVIASLRFSAKPSAVESS